MNKSPRYTCVYCNLSGDQFDLIRDHIKDYHKVEKIKEVHTKKEIWLG